MYSERFVKSETLFEEGITRTFKKFIKADMRSFIFIPLLSTTQVLF